MLTLGIESSCDETGLALYDSERGLLAHVLHSQMSLHAEYGGVVPELASRDHLRRLTPLLREVLSHTGCYVSDVDLVAYTQGPGLAGALLTGAAFAEALAWALQKPAFGVHHLEGHLLSPLLVEPAPCFPFVALLVSGGHTQLLDVAGVGRYRLLGETQDDAAGEAFDKSAKLLGLPYPGGAALSQLASKGRSGRFSLPRPLLHSGGLDFSFSGLKTAVRNQVEQASQVDEMGENTRADLALGFQEAICNVLCYKAISALRELDRERLVVAGGVGANRQLREQINAAVLEEGFEVYYPPPAFCTDNGAMIALAGSLRWQAGGGSGLAMTGACNVRPRWSLSELMPLDG